MERIVKSYSINEIVELFSEYVEKMQGEERHTETACKMVDEFDLCCAEMFRNNVRNRNHMYDRMMDCAVEYEVSGFIAGFQTAVALLTGQEEIFPCRIQIPTPEEEKQPHKAITKPQKTTELSDCITSLQIAEMFDSRNQKVMERIEKYILPQIDKESHTYFEKVEGVNCQNKPVTFYKLNRAACQLYLNLMEPKKSTFVNIAGGYAKLVELMNRVFPVETRAIPA